MPLPLSGNDTDEPPPETEEPVLQRDKVALLPVELQYAVEGVAEPCNEVGPKDPIGSDAFRQLPPGTPTDEARHCRALPIRMLATSGSLLARAVGVTRGWLPPPLRREPKLFRAPTARARPTFLEVPVGEPMRAGLRLTMQVDVVPCDASQI